MGRRHQAREAAVQCLYQWDITGADPEKILAGYWESFGESDLVIKRFAEAWFRGVVRRVVEIDAMISDQTEHWRVDRLGVVEKSVLRLGVYELAIEAEIPSAVIIDEAVELTKHFSGPEASPFVNGVLDGIRERVDAGSVSEQ